MTCFRVAIKRSIIVEARGLFSSVVAVTSPHVIRSKFNFQELKFRCFDQINF